MPSLRRAHASVVPGYPVLYMAMFLMATGNMAMMSLFPAIARSSGIPDTLMVMVQSVSAGLSIVTTPFWAARSDRVGRKPIAVIGMSGFAIASAVTACAIWSAVHHLLPVMAALATLVASRAIFGTLGMASNPAIQAHIADNTTRENRTSTLASLFSASAIGSIVGPAIAPLLILPVLGLAGPQLIFAIAGVAIVVAIIMYVPNGEPRVPAGDAPPVRQMSLLRSSTVWPFVLYMAVLSGCQAANLQTLGFLVMDRTGLSPIAAQPMAGLALMLGATAAVSIQLGLMRRLKLTPPQLMLCGLTIAMSGNLIMAFATSYLLVVIAFVVASAGYAFGAPAAVAGASLANSADSQGGVAGFISGASSSGLMIAPVLTMMIYHRDPPIAFLTLAGLIGVLLVTIVPRCARALSAMRTRMT